MNNSTSESGQAAELTYVERERYFSLLQCNIKTSKLALALEGFKSQSEATQISMHID